MGPTKPIRSRLSMTIRAGDGRSEAPSTATERGCRSGSRSIGRRPGERSGSAAKGRHPLTPRSELISRRLDWPVLVVKAWGQGASIRARKPRVTDGPCAAPSTVILWRSSGFQLVPDGQAPDALAGGRKNRVAQGGRDRWHARLTHAAHGLSVVSWDDVHANLPRRPRHARELVGVEVLLLRPAALEAHLPERGDAHAHDGGALHLGADAVRVHRRSAIDGDIHAD